MRHRPNVVEPCSTACESYPNRLGRTVGFRAGRTPKAAGSEPDRAAQVEKTEGGFQFTRITIRPLLTINSESDRERGLRLLEKAEKACLVSRSLQSQIVMEPQIVLAPAVTPV